MDKFLTKQEIKELAKKADDAVNAKNKLLETVDGPVFRLAFTGINQLVENKLDADQIAILRDLIEIILDED